MTIWSILARFLHETAWREHLSILGISGIHGRPVHAAGDGARCCFRGDTEEAGASIPSQRKEGDSYAITYNPAQGELCLFFNERLLGTITDPAFARAYFGIWLSDDSVSERFTDELLGREAPL